MEKLKFLFIDCGGMHVDTARKLGLEGHEVYYYCSFLSAYPKFEDFGPGVGVPEIKKIYDWASVIDKVDCTIFPDVGMGDRADWLRQKGYVVFGAGLGEILENDRPYSTEIMKKLGMHYPKTYVAKGVDEALKMLGQLFGPKHETNQNATGKFFIKFNRFRGSVESFPAASMDEAEFFFNAVKVSLGPFSNEIPITIQETVPGVECGADLFFNGEKFVMPGMMGFESGGNYIGYITDDMGIYKNDLDRIAKYLRSVNYRGAFSFECFYDGENTYWIDHTCRYPMPLGLMYSCFIQDYGKFLLDIATGQAEKFPVELGSYLSCMEVKSEEALSRFIPLKGGSNTRFMRYMMNQGKMYSVPGISSLGVVCAQAQRFNDIEALIAKESESLSVFFGDFNKKFADDIRHKYIEPISELGVRFGGEDLVAGDDTSPKPVAKKAKQVHDSKDFKDILDRWGVPKHLS
jgi:hypothetical protein